MTPATAARPVERGDVARTSPPRPSSRSSSPPARRPTTGAGWTLGPTLSSAPSAACVGGSLRRRLAARERRPERIAGSLAIAVGRAVGLGRAVPVGLRRGVRVARAVRVAGGVRVARTARVGDQLTAPVRARSRHDTMEDELVASGRFVRIETRGERSGRARAVTVGFVDDDPTDAGRASSSRPTAPDDRVGPEPARRSAVPRPRRRPVVRRRRRAARGRGPRPGDPRADPALRDARRRARPRTVVPPPAGRGGRR